MTTKPVVTISQDEMARRADVYGVFGDTERTMRLLHDGAVFTDYSGSYVCAITPRPAASGAAPATRSTPAASGDLGTRVAAVMASARGYDLAALDKRAAERAERERTAGVR